VASEPGASDRLRSMLERECAEHAAAVAAEAEAARAARAAEEGCSPHARERAAAAAEQVTNY
jgi:hypothetical protein